MLGNGWDKPPNPKAPPNLPEGEEFPTYKSILRSPFLLLRGAAIVRNCDSSEITTSEVCFLLSSYKTKNS